MSVNSKLRELLIKIGGETDDNDPNSELIEKITELFENGSDGGDSVSENFSVLVIMPEDESDPPVLNATAQELMDAVNAGKFIWCKYSEIESDTENATIEYRTYMDAVEVVPAEDAEVLQTPAGYYFVLDKFSGGAHVAFYSETLSGHPELFSDSNIPEGEGLKD